MSTHMPPSLLTRRTSRSSGSQSGGHPYRIEKPRSNHNSPLTVERRKTTTGAKLYATLDDHYNMMMGFTSNDDVVDDQSAPTRPVSWHPSSAQFNAQPRSAVTDHNQSQDWTRYSASSRNSANGSDFYSLSTRNSAYIEPLQTSTHPSNDEMHRGSQDSDVSMQTSSYPLSSYSTPATEHMPWYLQEWARKAQSQTATSQHGSTDFLPIQHTSMEQETGTEDEDMEDSGKELVGMGLYDLPDPTDSWGSSLVEGTGKGLKLEETWQPPEEDDDDDEEDDADDVDDADDASSEDGEEPPLPPPVAEKPTVPVNIKPQTPSSMEGQSFFFDEDDNVTKEWWFQHLKQPSLPVRDAGIGYGWL